MRRIPPWSTRSSHDTEPLLDEEEGYRLRPIDRANGSPSGKRPGLFGFSRYLDDSLPGIKRPQNQREHAITPLFRRLQRAPLIFFGKRAPTPSRKILVLATAWGLWLVLFSILIARGASRAPVAGLGPPRRLSCISTPWPNDDKSCDIDGAKCLPFANISFAFRCPPDCGSVQVLETRYVGAQAILHRPWVIGGPKDVGASADDEYFYRADSFICGAAIHAGIIEDSQGGCGIMSLLGEKNNYPGTERNGITSIGFNSSFPMSFSFKRLVESNSQCYDQRWATLAVSVLFTVGVSLFTTSPEVFYFSTFTAVFFQVALISDIPDFEEYVLVIQYAFSRFLPSIFIAFSIYHFCAAKTLTGLEAQIEKTVLWLGGCWFGALSNYTLDKLPLRRLTPRDISEPGAVIVLIVVVALIALVAFGQAWAFWQDGRLIRFSALYGLLACGLLLLSLAPGLNLRIHHYILALLLLPGTAIQNRPSLLFQGFLVGLFINGVARWGFASILETNNFLADKGPIGSPLPEIPAAIVDGANIMFTFPSIDKAWDGISMIVNDVERARLPVAKGMPTFSWTRIRDEPLLFRFGYFRMEFIKGILQGDYTSPGIWERNGTWIMGD